MTESRAVYTGIFGYSTRFLSNAPFLTLNADFMFVNGLPFLTILSRDIIFGTAEHIPTRTYKQLENSLMRVVNIYAKGGFIVRNVLMDGEFEKFKP